MAFPRDNSDLSILFGRHLPWLRGLIQGHMGDKLRSRETVSDLVQSVCREILKDRDQYEFRSDEAFRNLLYGQAQFKLLDRGRFHARPIRDVGREVPIAALTDEDGGDALVDDHSGGSPARRAMNQEAVEILRQAVDQLPDDQKLAMAGHLAGLSTGEIAIRLKRSPEAVRCLRRRALVRVSGVFSPTSRHSDQ